MQIIEFTFVFHKNRIMNYKIQLALVSMLFIAGSVQAQKFTNPFSKADKYTSIGAMASIPSGQFRSTDLKDGGYASTGWGLYFDSKTVLKNGVYFVSHSTYSWVPLNDAALNTSFTKELGKKTIIRSPRNRFRYISLRHCFSASSRSASG